MKYTFTIDGRLNGLNELINENRKSRYKGASQKKEQQAIVYWSIQEQRDNLKEIQENDVIDLCFKWYEQNIKRDKDNIASAKKYILDAMQQAGVIANDNWKHIRNMQDNFYIDRENPRVEVIITTLSKKAKQDYLNSLK